nr:SDR family NAD(P)-dependent oxidoreductase [Mycobacterium sp. PSTR-4-N]
MTSPLRRAFRLAGMRPLPLPSLGTSIPLQGKRILLTGASSGIGEVAAEKLATQGATVLAVARRADLRAKAAAPQPLLPAPPSP